MQTSGRARRWRRARRIAAAMFAALLAVGLALPLVVRGPVARWLFARALASRCGSFTVGGGELAWTAPFKLLFGRPVALALADVRIAAPDGGVLFVAGAVSFAVEVRALPWRIIVSDATIARGRWRLSPGPAGTGFADAVRALPAAGRAGCFAPPPPGAGGDGGGALVVRRLTLDDVDVDLAFSA